MQQVRKKKNCDPISTFVVPWGWCSRIPSLSGNAHSLSPLLYSFDLEDLKQYEDRLKELEAFISVDEAKASIPDIQTRILRRKLEYDSRVSSSSSLIGTTPEWLCGRVHHF